MFQPSLNSARTILCFGAHSDDIEIGCGGALLEVMDQNPAVDIHWVVMSGEGRRAEEARTSAEQFLNRGSGRHDIRLRTYRDSYFPTQWEAIKDDFHRLSRELQPDVVFTHRRNDAHQDHRVVSELTWCTFRNHLVLEYEIAKYEGDLGQPNIYLPISRQNARTKCDLLLECFDSQRDKPWFDAETFNAMLRLRGLESNSFSGYAEAFHCRKMCLTPAPRDGIESCGDRADTQTNAPLQTGASHVGCH